MDRVTHDEGLLRSLLEVSGSPLPLLPTNQQVSIADLRKYAWDHFHLHATQRVATFNFYITISTALMAVFGAIIQQTDKFVFVPGVIGLLLILFSFVFRKLDQRNKELIDRSRDALKFLENKYSSDEFNVIRLFQRDDILVAPLRKKRYFWSWRNHYSYSESFNLVFLAFSSFGIVGVFITIVSLILN